MLRLLKKKRTFRSRFERRKKHTLLSESLFLLAAIVFFLITAGIFFYNMYMEAPVTFPSDQVVEVHAGSTLADVANNLETLSFIRSSKVFEWTVSMLGGEKRVVAGSYYFGKKLDTIQMAKRLTSGNFGFLPKQVTIPEGFTVNQIADRLKDTFPLFDRDTFIKLAAPREGFLFPDTYEFFPNVTPQTVIDKMSENFEKKTASIQPDLKNSGKSLRDIIIMASIIEKEAKTPESRRIVSGILWKRLKIGMPLQVDAPFAYFLGKNTYELTAQDLQIDSPYNTYKYKGLPIGPIANPGMDSIDAALYPAQTNYLYYFSDKNGDMHYSETLKEHAEQKAKYM
ncbi:MAG TPA: endolytic transglycosylase MltG [Candidatus Paceibacterota bacterium]|nr:endolytic transglycosylase MltG [Candidatus Paceibacterota bacterium]